MNPAVLQLKENRNKLKMTVLYRQGGTWNQSEIEKLVNGLTTEVSQHFQHPEYLILFGQHTKEMTLEVLGGGKAYTAFPAIGMDNEKLPFTPRFS